MDVSIIIPTYHPDKELLSLIEDKIKNQKTQRNIEIIKINGNKGLANALNKGIKKSKNELIVSIHQDCIPVKTNWLETLLNPLKNEKTVASVSNVYDVENKKSYTPRLDEKGCAYKKSALKKVNYFDERTFLNSGEDMDMYLKLKKIGKIAYPHCIIEHYHPGYLKKKSAYKIYQNANTWGCLFRIYGFKVPGIYKAIIQTTINPKYLYWFVKGYLNRKQDYKK
jgi:GT2 family glycosyltransferase